MGKTATGALAFDSVITDTEFLKAVNRQGKAVKEFSDQAVKDTEKIDAALKKTAKTAASVGTINVKKRSLDFSADERAMLGFNQKLERTSRDAGLVFNRTAQSAVGFSNTFQTSIQKAESQYAKFASGSTTAASTISNSFKDIATAAIGFSAAGALSQLPTQLIKVRGEFQNLELAFETMLGNKAAADKLMAEVVQLAATTPFGLKDAAAATKQLLAYGSASTEVVRELKTLGDVAAGVGAPIQDLTYLYGTLRAQGRAYTVDIRQFAGRGIPIYKELANVLGTSVDKVGEFVESGKVGFAEVEQAFKNMTQSGGQFDNLMEKQSKSLAGLSSQLSDAIDIMFNKMGQSQEGFLALVLTGTTDLVKNYDSVLDILKVSVAVYGGYKTAVLLAAAATRANLIITEEMALAQGLAALSGNTLTATQARAAATTAMLQRAQLSLNATMLANPYVAAATALAALIAYFVVYGDELSEVEEAQKRVSNSSNMISQEMAQETSRIQTLVSQIKGLNGNRDKQNEKVRELISLNPSLLSGITAENIATKEGTKAIDEYVKAKARQLEVQKLQEEAIKAEQRIGELNATPVTVGVLDFIKSGAASPYANLNKATKSHHALQKELTDQAIKDQEALKNKIYEKIEAITAADTAIDKSAKKQEVTREQAIKNYDAEIAKEKQKQKAAGVTEKQYLESQEVINEAEKKRAALTEKISKAEKAAAKESEKKGPFGSVAYWEYVKSAAEEVLDNTPTSQTDAILRQKQNIAVIDERLEEARKLTSIQSFQEEIQEKKRIYEAYQAWVEQFGQEAADQQFKDLKGSGDDYVTYLTNEINKLKSLANFTPLNKQDESKLLSLTDERDQYTGQASGIDLFKNKIEEAKESSESLTETLEKLREIQDGLNAPVTSEDYEKRRDIAQEIVSIERERSNVLRAALQGIDGGQAKELEITKHYADLRAAVESDFVAGKIKDRQAALLAINKLERDEITNQKLARLEGTKEFQALNDVILATGTAEIKERLDREEKLYAEMQRLGLENSEEYRKQADKIKGINKELADSTRADFIKITDAVGTLGDAISSMDNGGEAGAMLGSLASGVSKVSNAIADAKKAEESGNSGDIGAYVQAAQAALQMIDMIITSSRQRKAAEAEYYNSVIAFENEYQLLLNDRIGRQSIDTENMFITDYSGRIQDGVDQYRDAQEKYLAAIEKVAEEGKVKVGNKSKTDWGKVGKSTATGAAAGAAFGPWGVAIGGVVGFAAGLFGGKKQKDVFAPVAEQFAGLIKVGEDGFKSINKEMAQSLLASGLLDENTKILVQNALDLADAMESAKDQIIQTLDELAGQLGDSLREALVGAFEDGTDAAKAMSAAVGDILEDMISKILFSQIFQPYFDQLQKDFLDSAGAGGDENYVDDIVKFYQTIGPAAEQFTEGLQAAADMGKEFGLDLFGGEKGVETPEAMTGAIATISQESANELNGQFNSMRITAAASLEVERGMYFELQGIKANTDVLPAMLQQLQLLELLKLIETNSRNDG